MDRKINSFRRLNGDPDKGIDGGKFVHALRSGLCAGNTELTEATGATTCNLVCVAAGELDISWSVALAFGFPATDTPQGRRLLGMGRCGEYPTTDVDLRTH